MVKLTKVDLSMFSLKAHDQGSQNSCVWNAIASTLEIMSRIAGNPVADLSRQQGYNDTRIAMNKFTTDGGSNIDVAWTVAKTIGIATEASFKYSIDNLYVKPGEAVHELAATQKVGGYKWLNMYQHSGGFASQITEYLSQGKPVVITAFVHNEFGNGNSIGSPMVGPHAYVITGVDWSTQSYNVLNSWTGWGTNGYGKIPFSEIPGINTANQPFGQDLISATIATGFMGMDFEYTGAKELVAQQYACILKRPAEVNGMKWWSDQVAKGGDKVAISDALINSAEGQNRYADKSNFDFIKDVYKSVLGREGEEGGLQWWSGQLDNGATRGTIYNEFIKLADNPKFVESAAHEYLANKTDLSEYISIAMQWDGLEHGDYVSRAIAQVSYEANSLEVIKTGLHETFGDFLFN
tara:strand:- start:2995 stop:4218 length:1224 start_codon:yes stop_codon:yes gene_type:complete